MKHSYLWVAFAIFCILSCTKYDNGGNSASFKRKISGSWYAQSFVVENSSYLQGWHIIYGTTSAVKFDSTDINISKNGIFEHFRLPNGHELESGSWSLSDDKSSLLFEASNGESSSFEILKLKRKELELKHIESVEDMVTNTFPSMNNHYYQEIIIRMKKLR